MISRLVVRRNALTRVLPSLLVGVAELAQGGQLGLLVNGRAVHLEQRPGNGNENNYGLGLEYDQEWHGDWLWFAFSSGFQSSQNETAYNAGGGVRKRYRLDGWPKGLHVDLGGAAMLVDHPGYRRGGPVPAVLPVASVGWNHIAVNAAYVPPVHERVVPLIFFQFMYSLDPSFTPPPDRSGSSASP